MKASAPGKLVLSGAYAVLEGAPAIVAAVDRRATADSSLPARFVTAEVAAAIERGALAEAPAFDASALRAAAGGVSRKLGLGSSAAILVASLGAVLGAAGVAPEALARETFARALPAHRAAQGGGSGIDVAASAFGGVLVCTLDRDADAAEQARVLGAPVATRAMAWPAGVDIAVYASSGEVATRSMIGAVRALRAADPARYRAWLDTARAAAERAADPGVSALDFVAALDAQFRALAALGEAAEAAIVTPPMAVLAALARGYGATFGPSGAGGGDVAIYAGIGPPPAALGAEARALGLEELALAIGAPGVHLLPPDVARPA